MPLVALTSNVEIERYMCLLDTKVMRQWCGVSATLQGRVVTSKRSSSDREHGNVCYYIVSAIRAQLTCLDSRILSTSVCLESPVDAKSFSLAMILLWRLVSALRIRHLISQATSSRCVRELAYLYPSQSPPSISRACASLIH